MGFRGREPTDLFDVVQTDSFLLYYTNRFLFRKRNRCLREEGVHGESTHTFPEERAQPTPRFEAVIDSMMYLHDRYIQNSEFLDLKKCIRSLSFEGARSLRFGCYTFYVQSSIQGSKYEMDI